jgi:hypothetical protein
MRCTGDPTVVVFQRSRFMLTRNNILYYIPGAAHLHVTNAQSQGFLMYPKSPKSEPLLALLGKTQNTPRESEPWRPCTLVYSKVEKQEEPKG